MWARGLDMIESKPLLNYPFKPETKSRLSKILVYTYVEFHVTTSIFYIMIIIQRGCSVVG